MMDNLPQELIYEILFRLPIKSILCSSCACKSWRSRILNPDFVNLHMNTVTNPSNHYFIAHYKRYYADEHKLCVIDKNFLDRAIYLDLPSSLPRIYSSDLVVGSCNGVLCLAYNCNKYGVQESIYLWNPATRQVKDISKYTIIFDRNLYNHYNVSLGFGFDIASSDYKVVRIVTDTRRFINRVEVYSLNENSWKEIEVELKFCVLTFCPAVVKGMFYWFIEFFHRPFRALVSFDVQSEKFCTISLPDGYCHAIFEFKQSVALTEILRNGGISIRILDDDNRWIEKFTITLPSGIKHIIGCLKTGEFVGQAIDDGKLFLYDSVSNVLTQLNFCAHRVHNYSESLVNLN